MFDERVPESGDRSCLLCRCGGGLPRTTASAPPTAKTSSSVSTCATKAGLRVQALTGALPRPTARRSTIEARTRSATKRGLPAARAEPGVVTRPQPRQSRTPADASAARLMAPRAPASSTSVARGARPRSVTPCRSATAGPSWGCGSTDNRPSPRRPPLPGGLRLSPHHARESATSLTNDVRCGDAEGSLFD
jgi:hypothetical protein